MIARRVAIILARMTQLHLNNCLRLAAIAVYQLRHLDVAIGIARGMMKRGDGTQLPRLAGTVATLQSAVKGEERVLIWQWSWNTLITYLQAHRASRCLWITIERPMMLL